MSYAVTIRYSDLKIIQEDKNMSLIINKEGSGWIIWRDC